jgi:hypothetical protein
MWSLLLKIPYREAGREKREEQHEQGEERESMVTSRDRA